MPGLGLRQKEYVLCGTAIQNAGRIDRIYCSASCRTLAWRTRIGRRPQHVQQDVDQAAQQVRRNFPFSRIFER